MGKRVGIDTGGTFTDLVALDEATGALTVAKRPSTPAAPERAVFEAIERAGIPPAEISSLVLGTTIATNALLQRKGARVLYLTTAGFEDVLYIQRIHRKFHYDLSWVKPDPFVERRDCIGVRERLDKDGRVVIPLDEAALGEACEAVAARLAEEGGGPTAVAINLLFSYVNPEHERRLRAALERRFPELPISCSHEVAPIWREYERGSTVVADAYIKPLVGAFIQRLDAGFRSMGLPEAWAFMKSNGGNMVSYAAGQAPIQLLLSGLAGGMIAGRYFGQLVGSDNVISLDMGGTSTDVGVVMNGEFGYTTEYQVEWGIPIAAPFIDLTTIGAGGGSIAWADRGGFLKVGPQSAGADPGPVCYGLGGTEPTVTDANLVLGRLDPAYFLGGEIALDVERARAAIADFGARVGMAPEETALAIVDLANENMANAIRLLTVERGIDPRDFDLCAFGGAGPLAAGDLIAAVGCPRALIPPHPGLGSAFGALLADLRVDKLWTQNYRSTSLDVARIAAQFRELEEAAVADLRAEGFQGEPTILRSISMRYYGQNYEQEVPVPPGPVDEAALAAALEGFHQQHERFYGYRIPDEIIELVHFSVSAVGAVRRPALPEVGEQPVPRPYAERQVYFRGRGWVPCPIYRRADLGRGAMLGGPAIVEEEDSTCLLHPGQRLTVSRHGILVME